MSLRSYGRRHCSAARTTVQCLTTITIISLTQPSSRPFCFKQHQEVPVTTSLQPPPSPNMVNRNDIVFHPMKRAEREQMVRKCASHRGVHYTHLYPNDVFICPWCGSSSITQLSMKKHWSRCTKYQKDHPIEEEDTLRLGVVGSTGWIVTHKASKQRQNEKPRKVSGYRNSTTLRLYDIKTRVSRLYIYHDFTLLLPFFYFQILGTTDDDNEDDEDDDEQR
jgi:hypothetical protein